MIASHFALIPNGSPSAELPSPARLLKSEQAADLIARDIQAGLYAPGAWLKQIDLERRYGQTRLDIRRALDRLVEKRLVLHTPNRGYSVQVEDKQRSADIDELRIIIETSAVESIIANVTDDQIVEIEALARRFENLLPEGTLLELHDANIAFHQALLSLGRNRELPTVVMDLRRRVSSALASQWRNNARIAQSNREHMEMVAALSARDADKLRALIRRHILQKDGA